MSLSHRPIVFLSWHLVLQMTDFTWPKRLFSLTHTHTHSLTHQDENEEKTLNASTVSTVVCVLTYAYTSRRTITALAMCVTRTRGHDDGRPRTNKVHLRFRVIYRLSNAKILRNLLPGYRLSNARQISGNHVRQKKNRQAAIFWKKENQSLFSKLFSYIALHISAIEKYYNSFEISIFEWTNALRKVIVRVDRCWCTVFPFMIYLLRKTHLGHGRCDLEFCNTSIMACSL